MPIYVYKFVDSGETIEIEQSFSDDTLTEAVHPETGETRPVKKVFLPVGITFKGKGFYKTDNRPSKSSKSSTGSSSSSAASKSTGSESSGSGSSGSGSSGSKASTTGSSGSSSD